MRFAFGLARRAVFNKIRGYQADSLLRSAHGALGAAGSMVERQRGKIVMIGVGALALSLPVAVANGSRAAVLGSVLALAALAAVTAWQARTDRLAGQAQGRRLAALERAHIDTTVMLYRQLSAVADDAPTRLGGSFRQTTALALLACGDVLEAYAVLGDGTQLAKLEPGPLRRLRNELRRRGYLEKAEAVAKVCVDKIGAAVDELALRQLDGEIAVLSGRFTAKPPQVNRDWTPRPGRILHVVGGSLPAVQTGYTLRTHYTVLAQRAAGMDVRVATQAGFGLQGDRYAREEVDGVIYHRLPGPPRGSQTMDAWLESNVTQLAQLVGSVRPSVLHAASDFLNALSALAVGRAYGIPVVYETRGFGEENWLSRQAETFRWDLARLEAEYGLPDVYLWRREIEDRCRREADRVVTLADVMADRIVAAGVPRQRIAVVPNGVDGGAFPLTVRDQAVAERLGISADQTVIGCVSSIVDHEGVDTLISAYATVKEISPVPVRLLVVGDGPQRERLMAQASAMGLDDAVFTGKVAHDVVLDYYSLIDIFVVPRKPVELNHSGTPLNLFEAFSTGRTVVLSDVRALAKIAERSAAAELFEAGQARSLAEVLGKLLTDPQRRAELAQAGARWVRAERTWSANAAVYGGLYAELLDEAAANMPIERLTAVQDMDALRRDLAERDPLPLEVLGPADGRPGADRIMEEGWSPAPAAEWVKLDPPIDWTGLWAENRQWNFRLHSWDFMGPVLHSYATTGDRRYLDWCAERAADWAQRFNEDDTTDSMAWSDMAIGHRCHRLAYLVEQALLGDTDPALPGDTDPAWIETLLTCVVRHQQRIHSDELFNPRNNQGVYLAVGQLALARRLRAMPGMGTLRSQGLRRLNQIFDSQFGADGAHLEHSPGYHHLVIETLGSAVDAGLIVGEGLRARLHAAEDVLGWFIQPNGELAQVGDTQARQMRFCSSTSPTTDFHMSGGWRGVPDRRQLMVLPQAGYAIVRAPAPQGTEDHLAATYLLFNAGFHSRAHKHADDLSFTWFDRGREILIDSGRFGYVDPLPPDSPLREQGFFYGDLQRQYVESTRAHNTVQADTADHLRQGRRPYGSALLDCAESQGHFKLSAQVDHGAWSHRREIICRPGNWLAVFDTVRGLDHLPHDFRTWWQFPAELELRADGERLVGSLGADQTDRLWVTELSGATPVAPVCGHSEPLQGWRSKFDAEFEPAWSAAFEMPAVCDHTFVTLFSFGECPIDAMPEHPFRAAGEQPAVWGRHLAEAGRHPADTAQGRGRRLAQPTRSPRLTAEITDVPLAKQAYWLDCDLRPGQTYRLRAVMGGGRGTQEKAALACFDMDGEPGGAGLAVSGSVGAYTYLRTGEGLLRTDKTFAVAHPVRRIGLRSWGNRGQGELKTFSIEAVAPPQSPSDSFFSFNVEAWDRRAAGRPIDTLVWGKLDGGEYGIGRICQVLEQYGIKGNFLVDFATCTLEGEAATRTIIDRLLERGHEVHLHLHPEHLIPTWGVRIPTGRSTQMGRLPFDLSRQLLDFAMTRYEHFVGSPPRVFRSGSYSMNPDLVLAAGVLGIEALSNVRGDRIADPSLGGDNGGHHEPFVWENGVTEIPVDVTSPEIGAWENYLRKFDTAMSCKPTERTFNVVMHSWSLLRRNADGVHDAYEPEYERRLHQMCRHAQTCGRAHGYLEYLDGRRWARPVVDICQIRSDQPREVVYLRSEEQVACTVCGYVLSAATAHGSCPGCDSSVFHRQLKNALGEFGNVFCGRATLAYGMSADGRRERLLGAPSADVGWWPGLGDAPVQLKPRFPDQSQDCFVLLDEQTPIMNAGLALREIERVLRVGGVFVFGQAHPLTASEQWARIAADGFDVCALPALDPVAGTCGRIMLAYKRPARDEIT